MARESVSWPQSEVDAHYERLKRPPEEKVSAPAVGALGASGGAARRKPRMNKLEAEYAQQLELDLRAGLISWWAFEPFKLRLATGAYFKPDFAVLEMRWHAGFRVGFLAFMEIKGFWREAARVRIKVAAEMYPFKFVAITKRRKRDGGGWTVEEFGL